MSPRLETRFWCGRALASPRAPWHRARHPTGKGSGVATCPVTLDPLLVREGSAVATCSQARHPVGKGFGVTTTPDPPPGTGGLWGHHIRPGPSPRREGLHCRHVSRGSRPASDVGGLWHHHMPHGSQPTRCAHAFPRCLASGSSWPHQACRAGSALNAYKTSQTFRIASIKCIQGIDMARW
jgi:hypothetical protein